MGVALKARAKVQRLHSVESAPSAGHAASGAPFRRSVKSAVRRSMPAECQAALCCESFECCVESAKRAYRLR
eukprot:6183852-Pleurochrysis_carterae.AAC.1